MKTKRMITSLSPYLKEKVEKMSEKLGCSQAEVVRVALLKLAEEEL
jgi:hypothetical protein